MRRFVPLLAMTLLLVACESTSPSPAPPPPPPPPPPPSQSVDAPPTPAPAPVPEDVATCQPPSTCGPYVDCTPGTDASRLIEIAVDQYGTATPSCVRFKKGNSAVVWTGPADSQLEIRFKAKEIQPDPKKDLPLIPQCAGNQCFLAKVNSQKTDGDFLYEICVANKDGKKAYCDPKLIIQP